MSRPNFMRAVGAAAIASAAALALTLAPSSADVGPVVGSGTNNVSFSYVLDAEDPISSTRPSASVPCGSAVSAGAGPFSFVTTTLTVSVSGTYTFGDLIREEAGAGLEDAHLEGYTTPVPSELTPTCAFSIDDSGTAELVSGQTYYVALTSFAGDSIGSFGYRITGPGDITIEAEPEGVSFEQAQAACAPGAAAPAGYNVVDGTSRNDTLRGTEGNDLIRGLGGQDTLVGLGGDDILCGGTGQDTLRGGAGEDFLFGEAGQDVLYGDADDDVLAGGDGNDVHDGGAGTDVALDTVGNNTFRSIESRQLAPAPQPTVTANR